jgi:hypothetical protein
MGKDLLVHKPDGSAASLLNSVESFDDTALPGVYAIEGSNQSRSFAVNLDPVESKTAPMQHEILERLGCRLADHVPTALSQSELRQMHNEELENRQQLWRWLILAAIGLLLIETLLAGRRMVSREPAKVGTINT